MKTHKIKKVRSATGELVVEFRLESDDKRYNDFLEGMVYVSDSQLKMFAAIGLEPTEIRLTPKRTRVLAGWLLEMADEMEAKK